jgi:hypothetical protein
VNPKPVIPEWATRLAGYTDRQLRLRDEQQAREKGAVDRWLADADKEDPRG